MLPRAGLLIAEGADVNHVSETGWTAVGAALNGRHIQFLKLLLDHGADANSTWNGMSIEEWLHRHSFSPKTATAVRELLRQYRKLKRAC